MDDDHRTACAVCGRILDEQFQDGQSIGFRHGLQDAGDHIAVPVKVSEIRVAERCDFCNVDLGDESYVLPVRDFEVAPGHMNRGDFAMCPDCKTAFSFRDPKPLIRRVIQAPRSNPMSDVRVAAYWIGLVIRHTYGDPVRWNGG